MHLSQRKKTEQKKKALDTLPRFFQIWAPVKHEFSLPSGNSGRWFESAGKFAKSQQKSHRRRNYSAEKCFIKRCQAAVCRHRRESCGPRREQPSETKHGGGVAPLTLFTWKKEKQTSETKGPLAALSLLWQPTDVVDMQVKLLFWLVQAKGKRRSSTQNLLTMLLWRFQWKVAENVRKILLLR